MNAAEYYLNQLWSIFKTGSTDIGNVNIPDLLVPTHFEDQATVAIGTIATVWTPAAGKRIRLMGGCISLSAAASILFEDNGAGVTLFRTPKLASDTPYNFDIGNGILLPINHVLKATSSAAANLLGTLYGIEE